MEKNKVTQILSQYKNLVPNSSLLLLQSTLERSPDDAADKLTFVKMYNPIVVLILSLFAGGLGVDRFFIGDIGLGVCKLLFGWITFGIWPLVDIFCCYKKAKQKNLQNLQSALL